MASEYLLFLSCLKWCPIPLSLLDSCWGWYSVEGSEHCTSGRGVLCVPGTPEGYDAK